MENTQEVQQHPRTKFLKRTMEIIRQTCELSDATVETSSPQQTYPNSKVVKKERSFTLELAYDSNHEKPSKNPLQIKLQTNDTTYTCESAFLIEHVTGTDRNPEKYIYQLEGLRTGNKASPGFFRVVLPISSRFTFYPLFSTSGFEHDGHGQSTARLVETRINNKILQLFEIVDTNNPGAGGTDQAFLVIDCLDKVTGEEFDDLFFSALASIGFLTGHFAQDECYIVSSEDEDFHKVGHLEHRTLPDTIHNQYKLLYADFNAFLENDDAKKYKDKASHIDSNTLKNLADLCHRNSIFLGSIILFLEACRQSLEAQPACLSVCLEGICGVIMDEDSEKVNPISSKNIAQKLMNDLQEALNAYEGEIGPEGFDILKRKIENINTPTNKDRLTRPFDLMGINLSNCDKVAIDNRNNFLHAKGCVKISGKGNARDPGLNELYPISLTLIKLFYLLILKKTGYKGFAINPERRYGHPPNNPVTDEWFLDLSQGRDLLAQTDPCIHFHPPLG